MRDWNNDGKIDARDHMTDYYIFEETSKTDSNYHVGGSDGSAFKGTAIVIIILIVSALLLGVSIPGAVWEFFIKVLFVVGFFTILGKLFK